MLRIIPLEEADEIYRSPDLRWDGLIGDLLLNNLDHASAPGDLRAEQGLATQVLILLMTDRRVEESELRDDEQNRGWLGDSFDRLDGEDVLGSRLWLLRRRSIYDGIEVDAQDYAREALQPLVTQGAVARIDVAAIANRAENRLDLDIALYGRDGESVFNQKFGLLWRQIDGVEYPLAG
ncbi:MULTISPECIES: phage GP46 family protein [unclassified Agrobacterium]|uniref:phage GP46 family protein n=1 Tax=unclassified Agrobacterium TaxID=2632611 RepID=UPI002448297A|nr:MULTISPECIES: phage GP46 family protein [unclassified Agrobacterium]MDH0615934.1 phage GP46 family protein [Agrobacterium sp. GD03872]MDH0698049.1 phage GP46 family protein [Agrobacterium sp. GD03871]MDH1061134.1 phage GP46 family protein [Agrobacterium sp. GD03992]MDH2211834.1 phage GP46 family protein [Agrobacterium sp. GD03643]MDH2221226.1 phage GP46 family protein [Agrobacterium sp. GD03638]